MKIERGERARDEIKTRRQVNFDALTKFNSRVARPTVDTTCLSMPSCGKSYIR